MRTKHYCNAVCRTWWKSWGQPKAPYPRVFLICVRFSQNCASTLVRPCLTIGAIGAATPRGLRPTLGSMLRSRTRYIYKHLHTITLHSFDMYVCVICKIFCMCDMIGFQSHLQKHRSGQPAIFGSGDQSECRRCNWNSEVLQPDKGTRLKWLSHVNTQAHNNYILICSLPQWR